MTRWQKKKEAETAKALWKGLSPKEKSKQLKAFMPLEAVKQTIRLRGEPTDDPYVFDADDLHDDSGL